MGFVDQLLNEDEKVELDIRPHWTFMLGGFAVVVFGLAVLIATLFIGGMFIWAGIVVLFGSLVVCFAQYLQWQTTEFVVTNDRIITRVGVLAKAGTEIPLDRVMNISYKQSIRERLLNVGDLMIESAGENGQQYFTDVADPRRVQNLIYTVMEQDNEEDRMPVRRRFTNEDGTERLAGRAPDANRPRGPRTDTPVSDHEGRGGRRGMGGPRARQTVSGGDGLGGGRMPSQQGRQDSRHSDSLVGHGGSEPTHHNIVSQITELDELRKRGVLSDEEFAKAKRQLLDRL